MVTTKIWRISIEAGAEKSLPGPRGQKAAAPETRQVQDCALTQDISSFIIQRRMSGQSLKRYGEHQFHRPKDIGIAEGRRAMLQSLSAFTAPSGIEAKSSLSLHAEMTR
jgi:hypothetical protein